jgi:hypothetical protein
MRGGVLTVTSRGGASTVAIAERVANEGAAPDAAPDEEPANDAPAPASDASSVTLDLQSGGWRAVAEHSARPLTWLEDSLGTLISTTAGVYQTLRDGTSVKSSDAFVHQGFAYRRRIESINLTTTLGGFARLRDGESTYGANLILYEDWDTTRLRITGQASVNSQKVGANQEATLQPRGFIEYSWRATNDFFILPRLGYDGWYSTIQKPPASVNEVDDDVFNSFRYSRNSLAFAQLLFWWVPRFNDIFYLRGRATADAEERELSHVAVRPGVFIALGNLDTGVFFDAAYYTKTRLSSAESEYSTGIDLNYNLWAVPGSLDIQPGVTGRYRFDTGGAEAFLVVNVLASYRRGLRDFSSLELSFPEQLAGGVPWRGPAVGVVR